MSSHIRAEARSILKAVQAADCRIYQIWDGEQGHPDIPHMDMSEQDMIELMTCTDEVVLRISHDHRHVGCLNLVWGNEPGVAIADHTDKPLLDAISKQVNEEMERRFG